MTQWKRIKLTEARQVSELLGHDPDDWPDASALVRDHYLQLRASHRTTQALDYLGHALPRLEALAWAGRVLDDESRRIDLPRASQLALDTALRWIGEPSELHRRAAHAAAQGVRKPVAERFLAMAVFYSGGSIADPGFPQLMPPASACARFAVSAIEQAAYRSKDPAAFLEHALDLGERVAEQGVEALKR
jgi:hypothetical protein